MLHPGANGNCIAIARRCLQHVRAQRMQALQPAQVAVAITSGAVHLSLYTWTCPVFCSAAC